MVIKISRRKTILTLIGCIVFYILGIHLATLHNTKAIIIGSISIIFFGSGTAIIVYRLLTSHIYLVINDDGILCSYLCEDVIPWSDISGAFGTKIEGTELICLKLRNTEEWIQRLDPVARTGVRANGALGFPEFSFGASVMDQKPAVVLNEIIQRIERTHHLRAE